MLQGVYFYFLSLAAFFFHGCMIKTGSEATKTLHLQIVMRFMVKFQKKKKQTIILFLTFAYKSFYEDSVKTR